MFQAVILVIFLEQDIRKSPTKHEIDFGYFERKREPGDMAALSMSFGKSEDVFCREGKKSKGRGQSYTHTQAPNAQTLEEIGWSEVVVVIIMMYIYFTTVLFWPFPPAIYVYTHQAYSCT